MLSVAAIGIHCIERVCGTDNTRDQREFFPFHSKRITGSVIMLMMIACTQIRLRQKLKFGEDFPSPDGVLLHNLKFFIRQTCRLIEHCIRYCNLSNVMKQCTPVNQGYLPLRIGNRLQVLCDQRRILRHTLGMFLRIGILLIKHPADRCYRIYHQLLCIIHRMLYFLLQLLLIFHLKNLVKLIEYVHHNSEQTKAPVKNRIIIQILSRIRVEQYPSYRCPEKQHDSQPESDTCRYPKWHS